MNAHVLRKKSLAKNRIFILLPVLTLLVSWCQCFSAVAAAAAAAAASSPQSSVYRSNNMPAIVGHTATQPHRFVVNGIATTEARLNHIHFVNVRTHESDQTHINYENIDEKRFERMTTAKRKPTENDDDHLMQSNANTVEVLFKEINNQRSDHDFMTHGFLRNHNENASQNRLLLQSRIKRAKNDAHRNNLLHRLRMLPKINNFSSRIQTNSHSYENNIFKNSSTDPNNNNKNNNYNDRNNSNSNNKHNNNKYYNNNNINNNNNNKYINDYDDDDDGNNNTNNKKHTVNNRYNMDSTVNAIEWQMNDAHDTDNVKQMPASLLSGDMHRYDKIERTRRESIPKLSSANARRNPFSYSRIRGQMYGNANTGRQRRFCTARDPTTLAFEAPTVFEGKVRSMSSDRRRNFSVTFEVKEIFKRQTGLQIPSLVRLKFTYKNSSECDIYRETFRLIGHVRDELEPGKLYILFVNQIDLGNFTILGQPVKLTRKTMVDVRTGVAEKYGQRAYIESLIVNNATIKEGKRLRIVCKVQGHPPPKVTFFKDNRSIAKNRSRYQFIHLRRRSELIIKSAFVNDSGQYECRAKNKLARQPIRKFTRIDVLPKAQEYTRHSFQQINWTLSGSTCPVIGNAFCLNGGTCVFFKDVGEPACKCPDGFLGNRCETKNPTNVHSSTYRNNHEIRQQQHQCGESNYYGSYYC